MSVTTLPASTGTSLAPHVEVGGSTISAAYTDALVELRVLVGVGTVGRCTLRFTAPGLELATRSPFAMDAAVTVKARSGEQGSTLETVFAGVVTSVGVDLRAGRTPELVVVAQDKAWNLTHTTETATITRKTYADVLTDLVRPGLSVQAQGLPTTQHPYLLRSGTALSFIDEIARRTGASWVVHDGTLHVWVGAATFAPAVTLAAGTGLEEFSVRVTDDAPSEVTVRGWDSRRQELIEATHTVPTTLPGSLTTLTGTLRTSTRTHLSANAGPVDAAEAATLAQGLAAARGRVLARGRGPVRPELRPGGTLTVQGMGPANATYPVQEVEHVYTRSGFHTRFVGGDRAAVAAPLTVGAGAPAPASPGFRHDGLVIGTVERLSISPGDRDTTAPEGNEQVMALVSLPGVDGALVSDWARIATVGGGPDSGIEFLPEIGDEVVVGFEGGDARRPVVLGGLHGAQAAIPAQVTEREQVVRRRIVSRRGHVIEIGDGSSDADEFIRLHLKGEQVSLRLGKDRADLTMPSGKPLKIKVGDTFLEMDGNGAVKIEGTTVSIKGTQKVTVEGNEIVLKGTQKVSASAMQVELKAQATATVEGTAQTVVKGGMVQIN